MIVGSCIKYTAAAGKMGEHMQPGLWCWGKPKCPSPSAVCKENPECLGAVAHCEIRNGCLREGLCSKLINLFMTELRSSAFF